MLHRRPRVGGGDARQLESLAVQDKFMAAILQVGNVLPVAIESLILLRRVCHHVKNTVFTYALYAHIEYDASLHADAIVFKL